MRRNQKHNKLTQKIFISNKALSIEVVGENHLQRKLVEAFITKQYEKYFNVTKYEYMPVILACFFEGNLSATMGFRAAADKKLFLEQYIDEPIEYYMSQWAGQDVQRNHIIEVGSLAILNSSMGQYVIPKLVETLFQQEFEWVSFTATNTLMQFMKSLGIQLHSISKADPNRLKQGDRNWGTYYNTNPQIIIGRTSDAYRQINTKDK